ncbi:hypothetical protein PENSPDRAFT_648193 [Peniophora sp. CONT]|nr:hypothetical protein PENSPDRAFT_648193 [Peniophora sp. CONT]
MSGNPTATIPGIPPAIASLIPPGVTIPPGTPISYLLQLLAILEHAQDYLDVVKLEHVLAGIYIWEYFTTLDIEWRCYAGPKKSPTTAWIYSLCKLSALAYTITNLVGYNVTEPINCDAWLTSRYVFATLSIMCASAIVVLRIATLWDRNVFVMLAASGTALVSSAFWLLLTVQTRNQGIYVPTLGCQYLASEHEFSLSIVIIATSFVFLVLLTGGVARRGLLSRPTWWRKLFTEGIAWLALATLFGIPDSVLIKANRNPAWNQMLRGPEYFILIIGAIRLYSSLSRTGSFTTFRETVSGSSSGKPAVSRDGINIRAGGINSNSVFAVAPLGSQGSRGTTTEDKDDTTPAHGVSKISTFNDDISDPEAQRSTHEPDDVLFIRGEKAENEREGSEYDIPAEARPY